MPCPSRPASLRLVPLFLLALIAACGDDPAPKKTTTDATAADAAADGAGIDGGDDLGPGVDGAGDGIGPDVAPQDAADAAQPDGDDATDLDTGDTADAGEDADAVGDAGDATTTTCPGGAGCACTEDADCTGAPCLPHADGSATCAAPCAVGCPEAATCTEVGGGSFCVEPDLAVCNPCQANADCQVPGAADAACVSHGAAGSFCGTACTADADCATGYACVTGVDVEGNAVQQCQPAAGAECDCSPLAVSLALATTCSSADGCSGQRLCTATGLSACDAPAAASETCDGVDNDCDGAIDGSGLCDDGNPCTDDACGAAGCLNLPNAASCTDGDECTNEDVCAAGACQPGTTIVCDDGNPCTDDSCNAIDGCVQAPNAATCTDGDVCTTGDACAGGACLPGAATSCDDGNACTDDSCDKTSGCVHLANTATCTDGDACSTGDVCADSACQSSGTLACTDDNPCTDDSCLAASGCVNLANAATCTDGDACTSGDACADKACQPGAAVACDDGNPCTDDSCDPVSGCVHLANTATCTDGDACTTADACADKACQPGAPAACDDANPCTDDSCDKTSGCANLANTATCTDGDACTGNDTCADKSCKPGAVVVCDDGNACTTDACDPAQGCTTAPAAGPCSDGNACTGGDDCANGSCQPGPEPLACDDGDACTDDACDPASGCVHVAKSCDDGDPCTDDSCSAGECASAPNQLCQVCFDEQFPSNLALAGQVTSTEAAFAAWTLTATTGTGAPWGLGAKWTGEAGGTGTVTGTWQLPAVALAGGTLLKLSVDAQLGDPACGADDLQLLVGDEVVETLCKSTEGVTNVAFKLPGGKVPASTVVKLRFVAGKAGGQSGQVLIDNVQIDGLCVPVDPTCGSSCAAGFACDSGSGACEHHVVLSELASGGATAGDEFVELYNPGDGPADVAGLLLQYRSATGTGDWASKFAAGLPAGAVVAAKGYYLLASKSFVGTVTPDYLHTADFAFAGASGAVQVVADDKVLDKLGYGSPNNHFEGPGPAPSPNASAASSLERKASAASTAQSLFNGGDEETAGNGFDRDDNAADFVVRAVRGPQSSESAKEP